MSFGDSDVVPEQGVLGALRGEPGAVGFDQIVQVYREYGRQRAAADHDRLGTGRGPRR